MRSVRPALALLDRPAPVDPAVFPHAAEPLEEVGAAAPADAAAAFAFSLSRLTGCDDSRPLVLVTTALWLRERGRPFARGLECWGVKSERLIWVRTAREAEALWALEEALKSGAIAGGLATVETPPFVATRRLDFAARAGAAIGVVLRAEAGGDLSAARRRWRIRSGASALHEWDATAPGRVRLAAELVRRRDGPPGAWALEQDDETGRLGVAAGLAGHGLDETWAAPDGRLASQAA
jgi:protein ImuA